MNKNVYLRSLNVRDLAPVHRIEWQAFKEPWSEDDLRDVLGNRAILSIGAEYQGDVIGWVAYRLRTKQLDLLRAAVMPDFQRKKVGTELYLHVLTKLRAHNREKLAACVPERNVDACLWLKAMGARATQLLPLYFEDEDGVMFEYPNPCCVENGQ